eukprot:1607386-Pleurochrysis_carterae.AAC.2
MRRVRGGSEGTARAEASEQRMEEATRMGEGGVSGDRGRREAVAMRTGVESSMDEEEVGKQQGQGSERCQASW